MSLAELLAALLYGRYAGVTSGVLGILAALALAASPIRNTRVRAAQLQLDSLSSLLDSRAREETSRALSADALKLLKSERLWNLVGLLLLVLSFVVLIAGALYDAMGAAD